MTNEELVREFKTGNKYALGELTQNNIKLIHFVANKYKIHETVQEFIEHDELIQIGWLGFRKAVLKYNPDKENAASFSTFAVLYIRASISRFFEQIKVINKCSIDEPIKGHEEISLAEVLEDKAAGDAFESVWLKDLRNDLETTMKTVLSLKEEQVIKLRYGWDYDIQYTYKEIENILDIKVAPEIANRALRKMRRYKLMVRWHR